MGRNVAQHAALFLFILFTLQAITYGQLSKYDGDLHQKLLGMFTLTDRTPRDGYISLDEFISIILDKDFNGDNSISRQEWLSIDTGILLFDAATANRIFEVFDADKNGAVTLPDVITTFNTADSAVRRDGRISAFEFMISFVQILTSVPKKKI
ncbi:hypothetical protein ACJMK2_008705 [Sinanodonta woodiana]|uniref:EF-hand domain-containing protein n=1 Tax=Sinanodonta woodiana TaxID=1069815 RepID=A0ABD3VMY8_SINWO